MQKYNTFSPLWLFYVDFQGGHMRPSILAKVDDHDSGMKMRIITDISSGPRPPPPQ